MSAAVVLIAAAIGRALRVAVVLAAGVAKLPALPTGIETGARHYAPSSLIEAEGDASRHEDHHHTEGDCHDRKGYDRNLLAELPSYYHRAACMHTDTSDMEICLGDHPALALPVYCIMVCIMAPCCAPP